MKTQTLLKQLGCALSFALAGNLALAQDLLPPVSYVQPGHSGSWTDTQRRFQGLELQIVSPHRALLAWQTALPEIGSLWLYGDGRIESDRIVFDVISAVGGRFPGALQPHPDAPRLEAWGSLEFKPQGCHNARLSWTPLADNFPTGETTISRITGPAGLKCDIQAALYQATDRGGPPVAKPGSAEGQRGVRIGGEILISSADGLWRSRIDGVDGWQRSGLAGLNVGFVSADPHGSGRLFAGGQPTSSSQAAFHVSYDGGRNWEAAQSGPRDGDNRPEGFVDVVSFAANPDLLYASLAGGPGIAVSTDGGRNWQRVNGQTESFFGYPCHLGVLPERPDRLYQGCEAPLDFARIGYYTLGSDPLQIGESQELAGVDRLSNRRPQVFAHSPARPGWIYAGLEGALVAIDERGNLDFVYQAGDDEVSADDDSPYIYVTALWIDPANPAHLIFGGGINGTDGDLVLFETFDHGRTRQRLPAIEGLRNPRAQTVLALDPAARSLAVVVEEQDDDFENSRMRVINFKLEPVQTAVGRIRVGTGGSNR